MKKAEGELKKTQQLTAVRRDVSIRETVQKKDAVFEGHEVCHQL